MRLLPIFCVTGCRSEPEPHWRSVFWAYIDGYYKFPPTPHADKFHLVDAKSAPIDAIAWPDTGRVIYFSLVDHAINVLTRKELTVYRLPKNLFDLDLSSRAYAKGPLLFLNANRRAYFASVGTLRIRKIADAIAVFPATANEHFLTLDAKGNFDLRKNDATLTRVARVCSIPRFNAESPYSVSVDISADIIVVSSDNTSKVFHKGIWTSINSNSVILDSVNRCLWASEDLPSGLGEHHLCFSFRGSPINLHGSIDYPLPSPTYALDGALVQSLNGINRKISGKNLSFPN